MNYKILKLSNKHQKKISPFLEIIRLQIKKKNKKFDGNLSLLHNFVEKSKINKIRMTSFNLINKSKWQKIIKEIAFDEIKKILGPDLLIQTKLNLSIQMPGDTSSLLPAHSDTWSSDSPFQLNLWIPLTNTYSTNSMFMFTEKETLNLFNKISKDKKKIQIRNPNKKDFIKLKFGQLLIFNPGILHGNVINKTKHTRASLNVRIKSIFSPQPGDENNDRKFGTYYNLFNVSENTKFALKILKSRILD